MATSLMPSPDTVLVQFSEEEALAATQSDERQAMGHDAPMPFKWTEAVMATVMAIGSVSENGPEIDAEPGDTVVIDPDCAIRGLRVQEGLFLIGSYNVRAVVKESGSAT